MGSWNVPLFNAVLNRNALPYALNDHLKCLDHPRSAATHRELRETNPRNTKFAGEPGRCSAHAGQQQNDVVALHSIMRALPLRGRGSHSLRQRASTRAKADGRPGLQAHPLGNARSRYGPWIRLSVGPGVKPRHWLRRWFRCCLSRSQGGLLDAAQRAPMPQAFAVAGGLAGDQPA